MYWAESPSATRQRRRPGGFFVSGATLRFVLCTMPWDFSIIADRLGQAIESAEQELRLEQAVYGLDARDERSLQQLLAERMAAFYEVAREVHYPSTAGRKLTHRPRCDLVLTPTGKPLKLDIAPPTLFDPADL